LDHLDIHDAEFGKAIGAMVEELIIISQNKRIVLSETGAAHILFALAVYTLHEAVGVLP
jgi:hypothetical protein